VSGSPAPDPLDERRGVLHKVDPDHPDLPDGVSPLGVTTPLAEHHAFVLTAAAVVALLALIFTLSWVVYHQLEQTQGPQQGPGQGPAQPSQSQQTGSSTPGLPTLS
jgi:hypothetical protein